MSRLGVSRGVRITRTARKATSTIQNASRSHATPTNDDEEFVSIHANIEDVLKGLFPHRHTPSLQRPIEDGQPNPTGSRVQRGRRRDSLSQRDQEALMRRFFDAELQQKFMGVRRGHEMVASSMMAMCVPLEALYDAYQTVDRCLAPFQDTQQRQSQGADTCQPRVSVGKRRHWLPDVYAQTYMPACERCVDQILRPQRAGLSLWFGLRNLPDLPGTLFPPHTFIQVCLPRGLVFNHIIRAERQCGCRPARKNPSPRDDSTRSVSHPTPSHARDSRGTVGPQTPGSAERGLTHDGTCRSARAWRERLQAFANHTVYRDWVVIGTSSIIEPNPHPVYRMRLPCWLPDALIADGCQKTASGTAVGVQTASVAGSPRPPPPPPKPPVPSPTTKDPAPLLSSHSTAGSVTADDRDVGARTSIPGRRSDTTHRQDSPRHAISAVAPSTRRAYAPDRLYRSGPGYNFFHTQSPETQSQVPVVLQEPATQNAGSLPRSAILQPVLPSTVRARPSTHSQDAFASALRTSMGLGHSDNSTRSPATVSPGAGGGGPGGVHVPVPVGQSDSVEALSDTTPQPTSASQAPHLPFPHPASAADSLHVHSSASPSTTPSHLPDTLPTPERDFSCCLLVRVFGMRADDGPQPWLSPRRVGTDSSGVVTHKDRRFVLLCESRVPFTTLRHAARAQWEHGPGPLLSGSVLDADTGLGLAGDAAPARVACLDMKEADLSGRPSVLPTCRFRELPTLFPRFGDMLRRMQVSVNIDFRGNEESKNTALRRGHLPLCTNYAGILEVFIGGSDGQLGNLAQQSLLPSDLRYRYIRFLWHARTSLVFIAGALPGSDERTQAHTALSQEPRACILCFAKDPDIAPARIIQDRSLPVAWTWMVQLASHCRTLCSLLRKNQAQLVHALELSGEPGAAGGRGAEDTTSSPSDFKDFDVMPSQGMDELLDLQVSLGYASASRSQRTAPSVTKLEALLLSAENEKLKLRQELRSVRAQLQAERDGRLQQTQARSSPETPLPKRNAGSHDRQAHGASADLRALADAAKSAYRRERAARISMTEQIAVVRSMYAAQERRCLDLQGEYDELMREYQRVKQAQ